ncbi:Os04g0389901 [Oryza sativa Japonica Group]|uniref:Os04g0389901 protein n=3 Tax=Oryza sativa TaxID=4530 RepID=B9FEW5_ORYSJ|nr:hypothetical protein OsI_15668 [Oryza sativa Indica Group]EEE60898.1 hypothetical protein OsJ_14583 [Oryza sativa Japonica Group]BAS88953.1 Os04g0389901 [Oryza sativa Japonica Group]
MVKNDRIQWFEIVVDPLPSARAWHPHLPAFLLSPSLTRVTQSRREPRLCPPLSRTHPALPTLHPHATDAAPSRRRRPAIATPPRHPRRRLAPHANRRRPTPKPASPILHRALSWPASPIYPDRRRRPHHPSTPCLHVNLHCLPGLETVVVIGKTNGANLFAWDDRRGLLTVVRWKRLTIFRLDNENSAPHCLFFLGCDLSVYGYGLTVTSFGFRWKLRWPVGSAQFGEWEV